MSGCRVSQAMWESGGVRAALMQLVLGGGEVSGRAGYRWCREAGVLFWLWSSGVWVMGLSWGDDSGFVGEHDGLDAVA